MIANLSGSDLRIAAHWLALVHRVFGVPPDSIGDLILLRTQLAEVAQAIPRPAPNPLVVISLRYGLDGGQCMTVQEIAMSLGYTRERIRQVEKEVLRRLRYPPYGRPLQAGFYVEAEGQSDRNLKIS